MILALSVVQTQRFVGATDKRRVTATSLASQKNVGRQIATNVLLNSWRHVARSLSFI